MSDSTAPRRKFLPEPVETSTKTNRKFAPEPVETSQRSSKQNNTSSQIKDFAKEEQPAPKRRFLPQPVETSTKTNRKPAPELTPEPSPKEDEDKSPQSRPVRRFTPQLIETSIRSKKKGSRAPATLPTDKTDITPGTNHIYAEKRKLKRPPTHPLSVPDNTPVASSEAISQIPPRRPRKQGSMRPHLNTRRSTRQNSYVPALEPIESVDNSTEGSGSGDEEEDSEDDDEYEHTPSLSGSFNSSEDSHARMQLARTRESCDDRFSGYLLELAAKAAEKQLREQALAAFPNSDFHDPVEHFYDREVEGTSDDESVGIGLLPHEILDRRESSAGVEVGWAQKEMQQHLDKLERLREEDTNQKIADEATKPSFKDPFWTNGMSAKTQVDGIKERELDRMRSAASPPMLGNDLKFRLCPSPKATTFDTDQRFDVKPTHREDGGGLWGGYCVADEEAQYLSPAPIQNPPMIATPHNEREDPFASAFSAEVPDSGRKTPRPTSSRGGLQLLAGIDERLKLEAAKSKLESSIQEEFDDAFVTQVFNYLSLGYPSLAWAYDEEISKITRIAESELNKEDKQKKAQGHIGLNEKNGAEKSASGEDMTHCPRWKALRLYIIEWARQNPSMEESAIGPSAWGVRARRGSWAI